MKSTGGNSTEPPKEEGSHKRKLQDDYMNNSKCGLIIRKRSLAYESWVCLINFV